MNSATKTHDPYQCQFRTVIDAAHKACASDVHIEPTDSGVTIRFRVDGEMQEPWRTLEMVHRASFMNAVKRATNLAIGVSGRPQDSRCRLEGMELDLRVNLLPTLHGEKVVVRLLDPNRDFSLPQLGIEPGTQRDLLAAVHQSNGLVLISGPTGSGKTTTLYSLLCAIGAEDKNIVTLEDPVEYTIKGINQVPITGRMSFAQALRAVLRQDPDVILLGEIRDEETAQLACQAAATGHLVLSTLHANGATEVLGRLLNLGVDRDTLRETLRFSAAQRLVGKLCQNCCGHLSELRIDQISKDYRAFIGSKRCDFRWPNQFGCDQCRNGTTGRIPIIEYLNGPAVADLLGGASKDLVLSRPLLDTLWQLACDGVISVREAVCES